MAKGKAVCTRCKRERYVDRLKPGQCIHGPYLVCTATSSCKTQAKRNRKAARRG